MIEPSADGVVPEDHARYVSPVDDVAYVSEGMRNGRSVSVFSQESVFDEEEDALVRMDSKEFEQKALDFQLQQASKTNKPEKSQRSLLVTEMTNAVKAEGGKKKKGAFAGVFVPTCENMWGVLIFLRFHFIVSEAGVFQALCAVFLSFCCAFCTTSSMSATVSSGGIVSKGGPYYMISRALGPVIGASTGIAYWLAFTMLAVLETLGAVEGILMAAPDAYFNMCQQVYGSVIFIMLILAVWGGINFVTKIGIVAFFLVLFTMFIYYFGLIAAPLTDAALNNPWVTGPSLETFKTNWSPHYTDGVTFGTVLSVFFPCFTGILSGANRADSLKDPPKNLRHGTFAAIIFSFFVYSSYMVLWGMVADYRYLQGQEYYAGDADGGRRLAGGTTGAHVVTEIVWNPFPNAAHLGIIISSLSQALQCLVVAPKLLQAIAKDDILAVLKPLAPLSRNGEPVRALWATYVVGGLLVLMGRLDLVAPLLSMCFLTAYMFMNLSCFVLTLLKSTAWRPKGIHQKRWRLWYLCTSGPGTLICITIMFLIDIWWAIISFLLSFGLYSFISWKLEEKGWGSAMDGIRFQLALNSLIQLESSQNHHVNWRPQVLILYKVHLADEFKGIKHHEILRFYSHLRKTKGFCVVACVLEADQNDQHAIHKAKAEKGVIQAIMKEERIEGFAEVVVAPTWVEGTNYIIQLTGIGGLSPNTVLLDWPENWEAKKQFHKARDFCRILGTALAAEKAVLAVKGLRGMPEPTESVYGTIDIWWMIHDGGFMILLSWLLVQHRVWRQCHLRIFTIAENVTAEKAEAAAAVLTKTLKERRLFDVDVEVIIADDELIHPFTADQNKHLTDRHNYLNKLHRGEDAETMHRHETIPMELADLLKMEEDDQMKRASSKKQVLGKPDSPAEGEVAGHIAVTDVRQSSKAAAAKVENSEGRASAIKKDNTKGRNGEEQRQKQVQIVKEEAELSSADLKVLHVSSPWVDDQVLSEVPPGEGSGPRALRHPVVEAATADKNLLTPSGTRTEESTRSSDQESEEKRMASWLSLNNIIYSRSKRAQLVVMNLPDQESASDDQVHTFMSYCDTVTKGLERVMFVHSTGHEVFDISH